MRHSGADDPQRPGQLISNLFLDFMNPESGRLSGLYINFAPFRHRDYLEKLLNLYALWCGEYCILPPGVLLECSIAESAMRHKSSFLSARIVRVPIGDIAIDAFLDTRRREYSRFADQFPDLYLPKDDHLLFHTPEALIPKLKRTGSTIADQWEGLADAPPPALMPQWLGPSSLDALYRLSRVPNQLIRRGDTLTWPDLSAEIREQGIDTDIVASNRWLQHLYLASYNEQFGLRTITNLPNQLPDLGYVGRDLAYDYGAIMGTLNLWGFGRIIEIFDDYEIIALRDTPGFRLFRASFDSLANSANNISDLIGMFSSIMMSVGRRSRDDFLNLIAEKKTGEFLVSMNDIGDFFALLASYDHIADPGRGAHIGPTEDAAHLELPRSTTVRSATWEEVRIDRTLSKWGFTAAQGAPYLRKKAQVLDWLDNFQSSEREDALLVMEGMQFFSEHAVRALVEKVGHELRGMLGADLREAMFFPLGLNVSDAGAGYLNQIKKTLTLNDEQFSSDPFAPEIEEASALIFLDDLIGSGNQASRLFESRLKAIRKPMHYAALFAFDLGLVHIRNAAGFHSVFAGKILGDQDRAFHEESSIFVRASDRNRIREMAVKYGKELYPKHPLGYGGAEAMVAFPHSCPNNTLPIIWAAAHNEKAPGRTWSPLFDRRKQAKS